LSTIGGDGDLSDEEEAASTIGGSTSTSFFGRWFGRS